MKDGCRNSKNLRHTQKEQLYMKQGRKAVFSHSPFIIIEDLHLQTVLHSLAMLLNKNRCVLGIVFDCIHTFRRERLHMFLKPFTVKQNYAWSVFLCFID